MTTRVKCPTNFKGIELSYIQSHASLIRSCSAISALPIHWVKFTLKGGEVGETLVNPIRAPSHTTLADALKWTWTDTSHTGYHILLLPGVCEDFARFLEENGVKEVYQKN